MASPDEKTCIIVPVPKQTEQVTFGHNYGSAPTYHQLYVIRGHDSQTKRFRSKQKFSSCCFTVAIILGALLTASLMYLLIEHKFKVGETFKFLKSSSPMEDTIVVNLTTGNLRGYKKLSRDGREYWAFFKVPYAQPPIGGLRFEPPKPPDSWNGIREEQEVAPECIQKVKYSDIDEAMGDEDCLYSNIYTPEVPFDENGNSTLFPTLVYIHGGGFKDGNGSRYGPQYFMDEDVVLITFQYRLGPFGFMSTGDGRIEGNLGFKDQVMLLKWVQDNIESFGGDPDNVMIFGNSGGGASVSNMMVSPMTVGLFHSAITQSGPSICNNFIGHDENPEKTFDDVSNHFNCKSISTRRTIRCLRRVNASELAIVRTDNTKYLLVIENYRRAREGSTFMPDTPLNLMRQNQSHNVPWIIGINSEEFVAPSLRILMDAKAVKELNENWNERISKLLGLNSSAIDEDTMSSDIKDFYFNNQPVSLETEKNLTNLISDRLINHCSYLTALLHSKTHPRSAFLYFLSRIVGKSYAQKHVQNFDESLHGVSHADELQFLFPYGGYPVYQNGSEFYSFSKALVKIWSDFAETRVPSVPDIYWPPVDELENVTNWMELNDQFRLITSLEPRMKFWNRYSYDDLNYS